MAIFNEQYLQEMKTKEEYRRKSFKKKYNYKPSKDNKDIGEIEVDGKDIEVDMGKNKLTSITTGPIIRQQPVTDLGSKNNKIILSDRFFKLKGSNKNQRRDAVLQHEIGHSRLHGVSADNDKKSPKVYKDILSNNLKDGNVKDPQENKETVDLIYDNLFGKDYEKNADKSKYKDREKAYNKAKKYDADNAHTHAHEFEADRYAANKTSASAIKRGVRNFNKIISNDKEIKSDVRTIRKYTDGITNYDISKKGMHDIKKNMHNTQKKDYEQRIKALRDKGMQNEKLYK